MEEVHRVSVPKPQEGEKLGLTVQQQDKCVVVTRILSGGLVDQVRGKEQIKGFPRANWIDHQVELRAVVKFRGKRHGSAWHTLIP